MSSSLSHVVWRSGVGPWIVGPTVLKRKNTFTLGLNTAKIRVTSKKASDKSGLELNFVWKSPSISPPPPSGAWGAVERSIWLKHNIVLRRENTFTLGLNAAKNTHLKKLQIKVARDRILYKKVREQICLSPHPSPEWSLGFERLIWLKYYIQIYTLKKKLKLFRIQFLKKNKKKKISGRICLSTAGVEVRGFKHLAL